MHRLRNGWRECPNVCQGSVLILVVWSIALLSFLVTALSSRVAFSITLSERLDRDLRASYVAWGGVQYALQILEADLLPHADGLSEDWVDDQEIFAHQTLGEGSFHIVYNKLPEEGGGQAHGLVDAERKLNLNTAPLEALQTVLLRELKFFPESQLLIVADSILDWRDEDNDPHPYGAENFYYYGLEQPYECKDGPFESMEELLLVRAMTPDLYARVAPYLTVYGSGKVNINTAGRTVLSALGLTSSGVSGIVFYRAGEDNAEGTSDDRILTSVHMITSELDPHVPAEDLGRLGQLIKKNLLTVQSEAFEIFLEAKAGNEEQFETLWCVVNRKGQILAWRQG